MTNKETINRNLGLTFDFVDYLIDNPSVVENLPDKFKLEFVEKDFAKVTKNDFEDNGSRIRKKFVKVRNAFEISKTS